MRYRGVVQKGQGRGAKLGVPTVNIPLGPEKLSGIFAAKVFVDGTEYSAAAYADGPHHVLEAHLLDFSEDLYGKDIEIELLKRVRDSKKFNDESELQKAIAEDIANIREYFKN